jgi:peptidoglycan/LPS O-acetylase OafA/YrhL
MPANSIEIKRPHLGYLDSARGIAALMVLFYHFINWRYDKLLSIKLASFIFNGRDAVSFFFVLSGFVLSYKYIVLKEPLDVRKFFVNRFLRLFPAFFVTLIIDALYWQRHDLHLHRMYEVFILNKDQFWEEAYLFKTHNKFYLPDWTLVLELSVSFFMPFAIVIAKVNRKLVPWLIFTYMLISFVINPFFVHFALGLLISCYYSEISDISFRQTKWYRYRVPLIMAAFILYSIRAIDHVSPFGSTYVYLADFFQVDVLLYSGIASFIFLAVMVHSGTLQRILNVGILRFYGKISYGIYLIHWIIVTMIFEHWDKLLPHFQNNSKIAFFSLLAICLGTTTLLAVLMHYLIELPCIRLGKRITGRLKPSAVIS